MALPDCKTIERNRNASQRPALVIRLQPFDQMCFLFTMSDTKASRLRLRSPSAGFGDMLLKPAFRLQTDFFASDCSCRSSHGGARRDRTDDLMLAKHALSQLSYGPKGNDRGKPRSIQTLVGLGGLEPPTSRLSSARSNQLSYKPGSQDREATKPPRPQPRQSCLPSSEKKERRRRRHPANAIFDFRSLIF